MDKMDDLSVPDSIESLQDSNTAARLPATQARPGKEAANPPRIAREAGDEVNRFLLCALVSETAKHIKVRIGEANEHLPMTMIVRGVLQSYLRAAKEKHGPLAGPGLNMAGLRNLNDQVLKDEVSRHAQEKVLSSQARLAHAIRLGDEARIKAEEDALGRYLAVRDRLAGNLK